MARWADKDDEIKRLMRTIEAIQGIVRDHGWRVRLKMLDSSVVQGHLACETYSNNADDAIVTGQWKYRGEVDIVTDEGRHVTVDLLDVDQVLPPSGQNGS